MISKDNLLRLRNQLPQLSFKGSQAFKSWMDQCILLPREAGISRETFLQTDHGDRARPELIKVTLRHGKHNSTNSLFRPNLEMSLHISTFTLMSYKHVSIHLLHVDRASVLSKDLRSAKDQKMNESSLCHHFQIKTRPHVQEKQVL